MGANNWTICPRCMEKAVERKDQLQKEVAKNYGEIPVDQFNRLHAAAQKDINLEQTLREDYEFNMDDGGNFLASYRAHCSVCDFVYEFEHSERIDL